MARLLGILMLLLTVSFAVRAGAEDFGKCQASMHATQVQHGPLHANPTATDADHAAMAGVCKMVCGTIAVLLSGTSTVQVLRPEVRVPVPDGSPIRSIGPNPFERPPRPLI